MLHHVKEHVKDLVLPNNMFDDMGFYYIGPVDGHDEQQLEKMLRWARDLRQPVLLHVVTQKGKGISYTEQAGEIPRRQLVRSRDRGAACAEAGLFARVRRDALAAGG